MDLKEGQAETKRGKVQVP